MEDVFLSLFIIVVWVVVLEVMEIFVYLCGIVLLIGSFGWDNFYKFVVLVLF